MLGNMGHDNCHDQTCCAATLALAGARANNFGRQHDPTFIGLLMRCCSGPQASAAGLDDELTLHSCESMNL